MDAQSFQALEKSSTVLQFRLKQLLAIVEKPDTRFFGIMVDPNPTGESSTLHFHAFQFKPRSKHALFIECVVELQHAAIERVEVKEATMTKKKEVEQGNGEEKNVNRKGDAQNTDSPEAQNKPACEKKDGPVVSVEQEPSVKARGASSKSSGGKKRAKGKKVKVTLKKIEGKKLGLGIKNILPGPDGNDGGQYVSKVSDGGMAAETALKVGDQLVAVQGKNVKTMAHIEVLEILKKAIKSNTKSFTITIRRPPPEESDASSSDDDGIDVDSEADLLRNRINLDEVMGSPKEETLLIKTSDKKPIGIDLAGEDVKGKSCCVVSEIRPMGFVAEDGRLRVGDEIITINGKETKDLKLPEIATLFKDISSNGDTLELIIMTKPGPHSFADAACSDEGATLANKYEGNILEGDNRLSEGYSKRVLPHSDPRLTFDDTLSLWSEGDGESIDGKIKTNKRSRNKSGDILSSASSSTSTSRVKVAKKRIRLYKGLQGLGVVFSSKKNKVTGAAYGLIVKSIDLGGAIHDNGRITVGDRLLSIDGISVKNCSRVEGLAILEQASGHVTLEFAGKPSFGTQDGDSGVSKSRNRATTKLDDAEIDLEALSARLQTFQAKVDNFELDKYAPPEVQPPSFVEGKSIAQQLNPEREVRIKKMLKDYKMLQLTGKMENTTDIVNKTNSPRSSGSLPEGTQGQNDTGQGKDLKKMILKNHEEKHRENISVTDDMEYDTNRENLREAEGGMREGENRITTHIFHRHDSR